MSSEFSFSIPKSKKTPPTIVLQDEEDVRFPDSYELVSDNDMSSFCKQLSLFVDTQDQLIQILDFFEFVVSNKFIKQVSQAQRSPESYMKQIVSYKSMSEMDIRRDLDQYTKFRDNNSFHAMAMSLWNEGKGICVVGLDINNIPRGVTTMIDTVVGNPEKLVRDIVSLKYKDLVPAIEAVLKCIPDKQKRNLSTVEDKRQFVFSMIDKFIGGEEFNVSFDKEKLQSLTQPGVALPHTMSPDEWVCEAVAQFLTDAYGSKVLLLVRTKNAMDVRRYNPEVDNFLLFSDDFESALFYRRTPALYCEEEAVDAEGNTVWAWRNDVRAVTVEVQAAINETGDNSSTNREKIARDLLATRAESYAARKKKFEFNDDFPTVAALEGEIAVRTGAKIAFRLYKAGYSSPQEIDENEEYLHVVSANNALNVKKGEYFMLTLPDLYSVLIIPIAVWELSKFVNVRKRQKNRGQIPIYATKYGIQKVHMVADPYKAFFLFFSLACVKQMLESWIDGEVFSYSTFAGAVYEQVGAGSSRLYNQLLDIDRRSAQKKKDLMEVFLGVFPGSIAGLVISPDVTRQGRSALRKYTKNAGYDVAHQGIRLTEDDDEQYERMLREQIMSGDLDEKEISKYDYDFNSLFFSRKGETKIASPVVDDEVDE
jgi:hypothetical protein